MPPFISNKPTEISEAETRKLYIDLLLEEAGWERGSYRWGYRERQSLHGNRSERHAQSSAQDMPIMFSSE
jgi:type I site-specific restriction endonuclease